MIRCAKRRELAEAARINYANMRVLRHADRHGLRKNTRILCFRDTKNVACEKVTTLSLALLRYAHQATSRFNNTDLHTHSFISADFRKCRVYIVRCGVVVASFVFTGCPIAPS